MSQYISDAFMQWEQIYFLRSLAWISVMSLFTPHKKLKQTECSEMSEHKTQTPENHRKERIQYSVM